MSDPKPGAAEAELEPEDVDLDQEPDPEPEPDADDPEPDADPEPEPDSDDPEPEPDADEPPPKPVSRAARRIQALDERLRAVEAERDELKRRPAQPDPAAIAAAQQREREEDERVSLTGDPVAISQHFAQKAARQSQQQFNTLAAHVIDASDKTEFRAMCADNPTLQSVADEVEKQLVISRSQGLNPQRVALAKYILGERMMQRAKGAKTRQGKRAAAEVESQRGKPGSKRSDVQANRRREDNSHAARAKRLDESGMM